MTTMTPPTHDYVATCPSCGQPDALVYDRADRDTAESVAHYLRQGLTIARVSLADLATQPTAELLKGCSCARERTPPPEVSYAAYAACGHMVAVCGADYPTRAAAVAGWIRKGLRVEQVADDVVRTSFGCNCPKLGQLELF